MSSHKTSEKVKDILKIRHKRSRSPAPIASPRQKSSHTSANAPESNVSCNVVSGSPLGASTSQGIASSSRHSRLAQIVGDQPSYPQQRPLSRSDRIGAFERAVAVSLKERIDGLSDDYKTAFQSATDVTEKLSGLQQGEPFASDLIVRVQTVQESLAIWVQHTPDIYSIVVGGLNYVMTLGLNYPEGLDRLTSMMEDFCHCCTVLNMIATAVHNPEKIEEILVTLHCDLLNCYVKVRGLFTYKEGRLSYLQSKRLFGVSWGSFDKELQSTETRFKIHTENIQRLVDYESLRLQIDKEKDQKVEERREIIGWLSLNDCEETQDNHVRKRFKHTGQWLLDDYRFTNWRDGRQSDLLWCHGPPGSGKTILASLVIDHLSSSYKLSPNTGISFIYCNYGEIHSPLEYIRLAIKQLCRRMEPLPLEVVQLYVKHYSSLSQPRMSDLQDLFLALVQQLDRVFFVLDGLNECTLEQRAVLCKFFAEIVECSTQKGRGIIKFFVASRKEPDIERVFLEKSFPAIEIDAATIHSDIKLYVTGKIEQWLGDGILILNNPMLKNKIIDTLTTNPGGMFGWVELQLEEIRSQWSDYEIEEVLENPVEFRDWSYTQ